MYTQIVAEPLADDFFHLSVACVNLSFIPAVTDKVTPEGCRGMFCGGPAAAVCNFFFFLVVGLGLYNSSVKEKKNLQIEAPVSQCFISAHNMFFSPVS